MNKFKVGARVIVIGDNQEVRKGVIQSLFEEMRLSIVKFDDGNVEKVRYENMYIDPETKAQDEKAQEKKAPEPIEKSEITITSEEFKDEVANFAADFTIEQSSIKLGMMTTLVGAELAKRLFRKPVEND